jgi:hypothetical protein
MFNLAYGEVVVFGFIFTWLIAIVVVVVVAVTL